MLRLAFTLVSAVVFGAVNPSQSGCESQPPMGTAPFDTAAWPNLTGRYRVIMVNTQPRWDLATDTASLQLAPNDSARRFSSIYGEWDRTGRRYNRVLAGVMSRTYRNGQVYEDTAEVERSTVYLGCRGCNDASPINLRIVAVSADGFWGTWFDPMTGIGVPIDKNGQRLPDPRGYFCAIRVKGTR